MSDFWRNRKVLVTGGSGFIGSHVAETLAGAGAIVTAVIHDVPPGQEPVLRNATSLRADLTNFEACADACRGQDAVFNVAHVDGSVAFKRARPAFILRQNMLITLNMLEAASIGGVERFLTTSSAEVYPHDAVVPTPESEAFRNLSDRLTDGYTWSKRISELASRIYSQEHGIKVAIARLNNVYGPGDYFDDARGRVVPMFIKRALGSGEPIVIWGTGETYRTFLYIDDLARGLLDLLEKYADCDPVNFGGDEEISLRALADLVVRLSGTNIPIICDTEKPSGAARRMPDITKAKQILGFRPAVSLEEGLLRTIESYRKQMAGQAEIVSAHS